MRICFFGDSIVNGTGDDACLGWTGRVCAAARQVGHDVTCYNLGIRRDTSADIGVRWRQEAERRLPPGLDGHLVFAFGGNDCVSNGASGVRVAREQAVANAHHILSEASAWLPTLMIGPAPVTFDADADKRIAALSQDFARVCTDINVSYLPVFPVLASSPVWSREAAEGDGTHPNGGGYAEFAAIVSDWSAWRRWLQKRA
jgi:lysophospholipase L1-like esterase